MFNDDFLGIDNGGEINGLVPLNEMRKIAHEFFGMILLDSQPKLPYRANREFAQFLFMFHVEQLRESTAEVKTF